MTREQYRLFEHLGEVDILEQDIWDYAPEVLKQLLVDHTMSAKARAEANDQTQAVNIFWATSDYADGVKDEDGTVVKEGFQFGDEIKAENLIGKFRRVVMPRVLKDRQLQIDRTKDKAEVFTPSWVCNVQNNLVDEAWFGRKDVFNIETVTEDGVHTWIPVAEKIEFPEGNSQKTWKKYVTENRMEITCGEAPYLVSRYDTTTGCPIPLSSRIGLLDRKMRVINENVETEQEWYLMAEKAFKHTYGYEWQGDSLLLAREALLCTFIEYFVDKFNAKDADGNYVLNAQGQLNVPTKNMLVNAARWISWNIWQMDGIKMVVPESCRESVEEPQIQMGLFDTIPMESPQKIIKPCPGCAEGNVHKHNGVYCLIRDWCKSKPKNWKPRTGEDPHSQPWQKIEFRKLLYENSHNAESEDDD